MRKIPLTQGAHALVDDEDYQRLSAIKWRLSKRSGHRGYAVRTTGRRRAQKSLYMHRVILNAPANRHVDHIDGDGLNNCRSNLRLCTRSQNLSNHRKYKNNQSGFVGVRRNGRKWQALVKKNGKDYCFGTFPTKIQAAVARDEAAKELHGNFARLNFEEKL